MNVRICSEWIHLSDDGGSVFVGKHGYASCDYPSSETERLAGAVCQEFDHFFEYYQTEIEKAHYAEINSVVYGREMG